MRKIIFGLLAGTLAMSGCQNDDLYNPNYNKELGIEIPADFNWSMTRSVDAAVEVNDQYNGKFFYTVRIYSENPATNADAKPVAVGLANQNEPFMQKITIPSAATQLYVTQSLLDADGTEELITSTTVAADKIGSVKMGAETKAVSRATGTNGKVLTEMCPELANYKNFKPLPNDKDEEGATKFEQGTNYYISSNCTITIGNQALNHGILYIGPGIKVIFKQRNGGNVLAIGNKSKLYNDGCITVEEKTATLEIKNDAELHNNGSITCQDLQFDGNAQKQNAHLYKYSNITVTGDLFLDGGHITMDTGSYINTANLSKKGQNGDVVIAPTDKEAAVNIQGFDYAALMVIRHIKTADGIKLNGSDNAKLLVQLEDWDDTKVGKVKGNNVNIVRKDEAKKLIYIKPSGCGDGFGTPKPQDLASYTYCMEDQFPNEGDYDLNDVVVTLTPTVTGNNVTITWLLKAVGATKKIAAGFYYDGTDYPIFEDAHAELGQIGNRTFINTQAGQKTVDGKSGWVKLGEIASTFEWEKLKFYIKADGGKEIYTAENGSISTDKQIIGGIRIPIYGFTYPLETKSIKDAYPAIKEWIKSNKTEEKEWYYDNSGSSNCYFPNK